MGKQGKRIERDSAELKELLNAVRLAIYADLCFMERRLLVPMHRIEASIDAIAREFAHRDKSRTDHPGDQAAR
jgi:hypothetical protein